MVGRHLPLDMSDVCGDGSQRCPRSPLDVRDNVLNGLMMIVY